MASFLPAAVVAREPSPTTAAASAPETASPPAAPKLRCRDPSLPLFKEHFFYRFSGITSLPPGISPHLRYSPPSPTTSSRLSSFAPSVRLLPAMHRDSRKPSSATSSAESKRGPFSRPARPAPLNLALIPDNPGPAETVHSWGMENRTPAALPVRLRSQPLPFAIIVESPVDLAGLEWCLER